jgi:hypothetical protein
MVNGSDGWKTPVLSAGERAPRRERPIEGDAADEELAARTSAVLDRRGGGAARIASGGNANFVQAAARGPG